MAKPIKGLQIAIPYPSHVERPRGLNCAVKLDVEMKVRCTLNQRQILDVAAHHCNMSRSEFMLWCSYQVAQVIIHEKRTQTDGTDRGAKS